MARRPCLADSSLMFGSGLLGAVIDLNGRAHYVHSGWFLISVGNLVVILAMIAVFALAIVLPFPNREKR